MDENNDTIMNDFGGAGESFQENMFSNEAHNNNNNGNRAAANFEEGAPAVPADIEVEKLKKDVEEYKDKYIRLVADFENFKRRNARERIELIQTAGKEIIVSLLDVLDDCDRAEKQFNSSGDIEQLKEGVQLVFSKLRSTLQSKGLKAMESVNTGFDVEKHEAITEIDVPEKSKEKVIDEIVKGYYLNDKLIRFAKVVVGK